MGAIRLTFDGCLNTAKQDAAFCHHLTDGQNGIVAGLGNEVSASASNGTITFRDGYVCVYGRRVYIEDGTSVKVTLDSAKYGYVVLRIDTENNTAEVVLHEGYSTGYPTLTKTDLSGTDGVYEAVLCGYFKTASSLAINATGVEYVKRLSTRLDDVKSAYEKRINESMGMRCRCVELERQSNGTFTFSLAGTENLANAMVCVGVSTLLVSLSLPMISDGQSYQTTYESDGLTRTFTASFDTSTSILRLTTTGYTSHRITKVYVHY